MRTRLTLTPYETADLSVVWRCSFGAAPTGGGGALATMGTSGGGVAAAYDAGDVPQQYLPDTCRQ